MLAANTPLQKEGEISRETFMEFFEGCNALSRLLPSLASNLKLPFLNSGHARGKARAPRYIPREESGSL